MLRSQVPNQLPELVPYLTRVRIRTTQQLSKFSCWSCRSEHQRTARDDGNRTDAGRSSAPTTLWSWNARVAGNDLARCLCRRIEARFRRPRTPSTQPGALRQVCWIRDRDLFDRLGEIAPIVGDEAVGAGGHSRGEMNGIRWPQPVRGTEGHGKRGDRLVDRAQIEPGEQRSGGRDLVVGAVARAVLRAPVGTYMPSRASSCDPTPAKMPASFGGSSGNSANTPVPSGWPGAAA